MGINMIKLYFKTLLNYVVFAISFFICFILGYFILYVFSIVLKFDRGNFVFKGILGVVAAIISLLFIYRIHVSDIEKRTKYRNDFINEKFSIKKDIVCIIKSKDFIVENLAFETVLIPVFFYSGISGKTPLLPFVVGTILLVLMSAIIFSIIDVLKWLFIHKSWRKVYE